MITGGEVLGLDLGTKRIGIARLNLKAGIAEPLPAISNSQADQALKAFVSNGGYGAVVIGLPRGQDGQTTKQTNWTRQRAKQLFEGSGIKVFWQDESLTTHVAEKLAGAHPKADIDSLAAVVILEDYFEGYQRAKKRISV